MTEQSRTVEALDYLDQLREASDRLDHAEYSQLHDLISAIAEPAACICSMTQEFRGGGHFELVIEPEPGCPEHGAAIMAPSPDREKLIDSCDHPDNCNHRYRLWIRLANHSNESRMRGKGSPNEESRVGIVFDWLEKEGFTLATPVAVDEAKLAEVIDEAVERWADMYPTPQVVEMIVKSLIERRAEWLGGGAL